MLDSLITSKTRIKLLLKFFANPDTTAYLRSLAEEFGESTNAIRVELNRLADAGLLSSREEGRTKVYQANLKHPLFGEIQSMVRKYMGIDQLSAVIFDKIVSLGSIDKAYVTGDYANGIDGNTVDVVIIGLLDKQAANQLVRRIEKIIKRKIRLQVLQTGEGFNYEQAHMLIWDKEQS